MNANDLFREDALLPFELTTNDMRALGEALLSPAPAPNERLIAAMQRARKLFLNEREAATIGKALTEPAPEATDSLKKLMRRANQRFQD